MTLPKPLNTPLNRDPSVSDHDRIAAGMALSTGSAMPSPGAARAAAEYGNGTSLGASTDAHFEGIGDAFAPVRRLQATMAAAAAENHRQFLAREASKPVSQPVLETPEQREKRIKEHARLVQYFAAERAAAAAKKKRSFFGLRF